MGSDSPYIIDRGFLPGHDAPWVEEQRRELEEAAVSALACFGTAALAIGGSELAAAERAARKLMGRAPFREAGYHILMQALAAQDNVAEALLVYDRLRCLLRDELGVAPGPRTQELHERLLQARV